MGSPRPRGGAGPASATPLRLEHPLFVVALVVVLTNDVMLRHLWPGFATGKLSDVAGLVVLGALVLDLVDQVWRGSRIAPHVTTILLALGMAIVKTWRVGADAYAAANGFAIDAVEFLTPVSISSEEVSVVVDPSDLLALPALLLPLLLMKHRAAGPRHDTASLRASTGPV